MTGIHTKWHRSFFYFVADYASPGPNALSPTFESPFTRLEYVGNRRFNLAYMRHTGKWWEVYQGLTLDKCLKTIRDDATFHLFDREGVDAHAADLHLRGGASRERVDGGIGSKSGNQLGTGVGQLDAHLSGRLLAIADPANMGRLDRPEPGSTIRRWVSARSRARYRPAIQSRSQGSSWPPTRSW